MSEKRKSIKTLLKGSGEHFAFVAATIISAGVHFVFSVYVKAYVPPFEYGIYSTCLLLNTYLSYLQLGSLNAFNRDYPQLIGAHDEEGARKYRNTVFTFILFSFCVAFILIFIGMVAVGITAGLDMKYVIGFILSGLLTVVTMIENFCSYRARIDFGFTFVSRIVLLELISVIAGVFMIRIWGLYAIFLTSILAMLIGIIFYFRKNILDLELSMDRKLLKSVLISGLPLLVNGLIWTVVNSIDKFAILGFIDTEALGVYGIAQNAFNYMILIPTALSQLFYAKMGKSFGANKDIDELNETSAKYTLYVAIITAFVALFAFFFLPILVENLLPKYINGVMASQILIIGLSFYAPTLMNMNILTILKKNSAIIRNSLMVCLFNVVFSTLYILLFGRYIECVAAGTVTAYLLRAIITTIQIKKYSNGSLRLMFRNSVLPIVFTLLPAVLFYLLIDNKLIGFGISLVVFLVVNLLLYRREIKGIMRND